MGVVEAAGPLLARREGEGQALLCDKNGFAVATGSSCAGKSLKVPPVLRAIPVSRARKDFLVLMVLKVPLVLRAILVPRVRRVFLAPMALKVLLVPKVPMVHRARSVLRVPKVPRVPLVRMALALPMRTCCS